MTQSAQHPEPLQRTPRLRMALAPLLLGMTCVVALVQVLRHTWLADDLFITMRYCDNQLAGLGAVYNAGEQVEGYTHFLWFLLLTMGRLLAIPPEYLGRFLGLPFFLASIVLLYRIGRRLLPSSRSPWGIPLAAVAWGLSIDAQLYTSGGLETAFFTCLLLLGFDLCTQPANDRRAAAAGVAFALATLTRPEGLLLSLVAGVGIGLLQRNARASLRFALFWVLLTAPHLVFRLLYYGEWFANTFYAKSAHLPYWKQGLWYLWTWISVYPALALAGVAAVIGVILWLRDRRGSALMLGAALGFAGYLGVTRGGGDYMFGRFFLPFTPFLWLLLEGTLGLLRPAGLRVVVAILLGGSVLLAPSLRARNLSGGRYWGDVADEPRLGTLQAWEYNRARGQLLARCFAGSDATVFLQGGQCVLGYYGQFTHAIEEHGLTDARIAHYKLQKRTRPGHEKLLTAAEVFERPVHFRFHYARLRNARFYTNMAVADSTHTVFGEILVYDRALMDQLKKCDNLNFIDFPDWLRQEYIPERVAIDAPSRLLRDYEHFLLYYFQQNPDPEGLLAQLQRALEARGLHNLDQVRPVPSVMGFEFR